MPTDEQADALYAVAYGGEVYWACKSEWFKADTRNEMRDVATAASAERAAEILEEWGGWGEPTEEGGQAFDTALACAHAIRRAWKEMQ